MFDKNYIISRIKPCLEQRQAVVMAFLFGSYALEHPCQESDVDIALYLAEGENGRLEIEIQNDLERLLKKEIDLVILNRSSAVISWSVLRKGTPIIIRNRKRYLDLVIESSNEAVDFIDFNLDAWRRKNGIAEG